MLKVGWIILHLLKILKLGSWLPVNSNHRELEPRTNSNQSWFPLDFLHTFTIILPSVLNSNLLLTQSNFCFTSDHFNLDTILPSITYLNHGFKCVTRRKKQWTPVHTLNLFQNNHVFFVFTFFLLQFNTMFSPVPINQALFF